MPDRFPALPPAQQKRLLEAARLFREECTKASESVPVADAAYARLHAVTVEIDFLTAELTGQPTLFGVDRPSHCH